MPTNNYNHGMFGAQGGYWGTGQDPQQWIDKAMQRLLSPAEYEKLDDITRSSFGGYMGYLNAYAKQQKFKQQGADAYRAIKGGTYEPFDYAVASGGKTTSTRGQQIPTAAGAAEGAGMPTTIHRDIYGRPTEQLAGGGIRRGMGGEVIPQTAEQYGATSEIDLAIPRAKEQRMEDILNLQLAPSLRKKKELATGMELEDVALQAERSPMERYITSREGQAQQRIEVAQSAIAEQYQRSRDKFGDDKAKMILKAELDQDRDFWKNELQVGRDESRQDFIRTLQEAKQAHDFTMQAQKLRDALAILDRKDVVAKTIAEQNMKSKLTEKLAERIFKLDVMTLGSFVTEKAIKKIEAKTGELRNEMKRSEAPPITGAIRNPRNPSQWIAQKSDGKWYPVE